MSAGREAQKEVQIPLQQAVAPPPSARPANQLSAPSQAPPPSARPANQLSAPSQAPPPSARPANPWPPNDTAPAVPAVFLPPHGGFRDHFLCVPEEKYLCECCRLVLCLPRQTECGHRFCHSCIQDILSRSNPVCPADMEPLFKDKIFRDVCCQREIMALEVFCRCQMNGCQETMSLQQVPDHLNVCGFFEVPCPLGKCAERMMRKDMPDHLSYRCQHRETDCDFCQAKMPLTELQKHKETVCPAFPVSCPNLCSFSSLPRSEMSSHQQDCPKAQVSCQFHRHGCSFKGLSQEVNQHESSSASEHLKMMAKRNASLESKIEDVKAEISERYKVLPALSSRLSEAEKQTADLREKSRQVEQKLSTMQKLMSSHSEKLLELELEIRSLRSSMESLTHTHTHTLESLTHTHTHALESLTHTHTHALDNLRVTVETVRARVTALEGGRQGQGTHTLATLETQLSRHDDILSVHEIRLADSELRFQVLETASYNGTLIWKIRDYQRRKQEAVAAKTLSLYSQPFYTGYFGYKMCARVYLNGDGMGKNTHLSLFFVVMRGEYDALLPWPFKQKVTLMLMDQGASRKHLADAFKPDPNSSSFRRPNAEMNIASGCPMFVSQSVLETGSYIKDDTIFIKVTVDTSDLPDP